jgi:hypothetical protein
MTQKRASRRDLKGYRHVVFTQAVFLVVCLGLMNYI